MFCTESSHGKCYSDHSFDYNGAMQNMSLGSVLRKKKPFFTNKQDVQGSASSQPD